MPGGTSGSGTGVPLRKPRTSEAETASAPPVAFEVGPDCPMCGAPTSLTVVDGLSACYLDELTVNAHTGVARAMRNRIAPRVAPVALSAPATVERKKPRVPSTRVRVNPLTGQPMPCIVCGVPAVEPHGRYCGEHDHLWEGD